MSSSGIYLFNAGQTPRTDRENLQQAHSGKSNAGFGRIHLRPKHAFGDLQNVMHNKTPLKGALKPQAHTPSQFVSKKSTSVLAPTKKRATSKMQEPEDLEGAWLENFSMRVSDFKDKVERGVEKKKKQKEVEWKKLGEELSVVHKKRSDIEIFYENKPVENLNDILNNLCVEPSIFCPPSIPDLPVDDFEKDDFFKW